MTTFVRTNASRQMRFALLAVALTLALSADLQTFVQRVQPTSQATTLMSLIESVTSATQATYSARDNVGNTMDTAKIIADPSGGYMAVYHTLSSAGYFQVHLATSSDLVHWSHQTSFGAHTHQADLRALSDGGFLLVNETDNGAYNWIEARYYASRGDLFANLPERTFNVPHTLVPAAQLAEGTPNIYSVHLAPDIDGSTILLGFHYFSNGEADRQAIGVLKDFKTWNSQKLTAVDGAIEAYGVQGGIGDRDYLEFGGQSFNLEEGQFVNGDFSTWRLFLWDWQARDAYLLHIRTTGGSKAFANPTATLVPSPSRDGHLALVVTSFLPAEAAAPGEAGELIFYTELR